MTEPTTKIDHGLTWARAAGKEWATLDGHKLVIIPASTRSFYHIVILDADGGMVWRDTAPTRPEARRILVFRLADMFMVKTPEWRPSPPDVDAARVSDLMSTTMRNAARMILFASFALMAFAVIARLAS